MTNKKQTPHPQPWPWPLLTSPASCIILLTSVLQTYCTTPFSSSTLGIFTHQLPDTFIFSIIMTTLFFPCLNKCYLSFEVGWDALTCSRHTHGIAFNSHNTLSIDQWPHFTDKEVDVQRSQAMLSTAKWQNQRVNPSDCCSNYWSIVLPGSWGLGLRVGSAIHLFYDLCQVISPLWASVS